MELKLRRELGEQILGFLDDSGTEDILLNPDGSLWMQRTGEGFIRAGNGVRAGGKCARHYRPPGAELC